MINLSIQSDTFKTSEVALSYSTKIQSLTQIKRLHKDELLEGIHYFTNYEMKTGRQRLPGLSIRDVLFIRLIFKKPNLFIMALQNNQINTIIKMFQPYGLVALPFR